MLQKRIYEDEKLSFSLLFSRFFVVEVSLLTSFPTAGTAGLNRGTGAEADD
jgi:hypothetical protein